MTVAATELHPGQTLLFLRSRSRAETVQFAEYTIERVGRVWAHTTGGRAAMRINKHTLVVDGGGYESPGRCYFSLDHYEAERQADAAWTALNQKVTYRRPPNMTAETIREAAALLGIAIKAEPDA